MINLKKAAIIAVIAILFASFIFSLILAIYERPEYSDYCEEVYPYKTPVARELDCPSTTFPETRARECEDKGHEFTPIYSDGCVEGYECRACRVEYDEARKDYQLFKFIMSTALGLIAVILSIYLPFESDSLKEWLLAGFLIGGLAAIFIGTIEYFNDAHRILRPIIILIELFLVVFVSYKKIKR
ncbi:hypothetical protein HQ533_01160 [Candidatus Woesearchaeota archaeon]|nr:hypothetical protein [Candidatus Woesearchaeota archaeon]